jgi:hypothetical protein
VHHVKRRDFWKEGEEGWVRWGVAHKKCVAHFKWVFEAMVKSSRLGNPTFFQTLIWEKPAMGTEQLRMGNFFLRTFGTQLVPGRYPREGQMLSI